MDFGHFELEALLRDPSHCPADRYILVAPDKAKPLLADDEYLAGLPSRLRPHYGWTLCQVRFRTARRPIAGHTILAVGVHALMDLDRWSNSFQAGTDPILGVFYFILDEKGRRARFGPRYVVMVEGPLRGRGVGRYTLSQLVLWAQALGWGDVEVVKGELADAGNDVLDENRERRNLFYERGGFDVIFADPVQRRGGHFSAKAISQLTTRWSRWSKDEGGRIMELDIHDFANEFQELYSRLAPLQGTLESLQKSNRDWRDRYGTLAASWWKPLLIGVVLGAAATLSIWVR